MKINFKPWFVGFLEGDGSFSFTRKKNSFNWQFSIRVAQDSYNCRALLKIKEELGVGKVSIEKKSKIASYSIQSQKDIINVILPIFKEQPLITSKAFHQGVFSKAILTQIDNSISREERTEILEKLKKQTIPENYKSPGLLAQNSVITKSWVIGFVEAKSSFFITKTDKERIGFGFRITKKLDKDVLEAIGSILSLKVKQYSNSKSPEFSLGSNSKEHLKSIISPYFKDSIIGIKAEEFNLWDKALHSSDHSFETLSKFQTLMRNLRQKR